MSESGLREHMRLDCSNPGVHVETLLEMLARQRARADALQAERDALREAGEPMTRAVFRLMATMEVNNRDARIDAYFDAQEPFQRWREVLAARAAEGDGEEKG